MKKVSLLIFIVAAAWALKGHDRDGISRMEDTLRNATVTAQENQTTPATQTTVTQKVPSSDTPILAEDEEPTRPPDDDERSEDIDVEELESAWASARNSFFEDELFLDEESIAEIKALSQEHLQNEALIVKAEVDLGSEEAFVKQREKMLENRRQYEFAVAEALGEDNWDAYMAFYRKYWKISDGIALNQSWQPIK